MKTILLLLSMTVALNGVAQQGKYFSSTTDIVNCGIVSVRADDYLVNQETMATGHIRPVPLEYYSQTLLAQQDAVNKQSEMIISSLEFSDPAGQSDAEDITPLTWKWVDLEMKHDDGGLTYMSLRRPNHWFLKKDVKEGGQVYFDWEDVGAAGWAVVKSIRHNQLDSRLIESGNDSLVTRPIIGKFQHTSNNVFDLRFDNGVVIGVTGNHPIWSVDKSTWVEASKLRVGELVAAVNGKARLTHMQHRPGTHTVYNIEVYKSHNYHVSRQAILVHNGPCKIAGRTVAEVVGDATITYQGKTYKVFPSSDKMRAVFVEHYAELMQSGEFNWDDMRVASDFNANTNMMGNSEISIVLTPDGRAILTEGHTRFVASRLAGVDIPVDNPNAVTISHANWSSTSWDKVNWNEDPRLNMHLMMEKSLREPDPREPE